MAEKKGLSAAAKLIIFILVTAALIGLFELIYTSYHNRKNDATGGGNTNNDDKKLFSRAATSNDILIDSDLDLSSLVKR